MKAKERLSEIAALGEKIARPIRIMEVCGTHTVAAFRSGLRSLLPESVELVSGPGCPVCVTPDGYLDKAVEIAFEKDTLVTSFGDMLRVPGSRMSLEEAHARGAGVQLVYSPMDALKLAETDPTRSVVFLGVGFETTVPAVAWTIQEAARKGVTNFSVLCAHKTIPEAMCILLDDKDLAIDGYLCPGHVSVIIGARAYDVICQKYGAPCVVTGFEPADMVDGIAMLVRQVAESRAEVEIEYSRSVTREGNLLALQAIDAVFEKCDAPWRGLGMLPDSGLQIREDYAAFDADRLFKDLPVPEPRRVAGCMCGQVLKGQIKPTDCGLFGKKCTPADPIGPCMVSSEGSCAAYYKYGRS